MAIIWANSNSDNCFTPGETRYELKQWISIELSSKKSNMVRSADESRIKLQWPNIEEITSNSDIARWFE